MKACLNKALLLTLYTRLLMCTDSRFNSVTFHVFFRLEAFFCRHICDWRRTDGITKSTENSSCCLTEIWFQCVVLCHAILLLVRQKLSTYPDSQIMSLDENSSLCNCSVLPVITSTSHSAVILFISLRNRWEYWYSRKLLKVKCVISVPSQMFCLYSPLLAVHQFFFPFVVQPRLFLNKKVLNLKSIKIFF